VLLSAFSGNRYLNLADDGAGPAARTLRHHRPTASVRAPDCGAGVPICLGANLASAVAGSGLAFLASQPEGLWSSTASRSRRASRYYGLAELAYLLLALSARVGNTLGPE